MLAKFSAKALSIALFTKQAVGQLTNLRQHQEGRDLQDGSFSFPTSIVPNDEIINSAADADAYKVVLEDTDEPILQQEEKPLDDGILHSKDAAKAAGTLVDLIAALKNGKNIDAVSSAVKEVVAKGVDGEDIKAVLNEVLTILVDLTWNENKKLTSSKSGKSSKKSSDDPVTTTPSVSPSVEPSSQSSSSPSSEPSELTGCPGGSPADNSVGNGSNGGCCETDAQCYNIPSGLTGPGANFCNANNVCECQVADGGNSGGQCCTDASSGNFGEGGCASGYKCQNVAGFYLCTQR